MVLNTEWAQVEVIDLINDGSGLAFGIIGGRSTGVVVKTILPGGVADRDGRLQSGDHILQIGEVNLRGLGSEQVASVLRQCGVHVRMVVARPVESTTADYQALGSHAPIVPTKILGDPVELDRYLIENGYTETFTQPPSNYSTPFIYTGQQSDIQLHPISGIVDVVKDPLPIGNVPLPPQQIDVQPNVPKMLPLDMALHQPDLPETEIYTVKLKKDDLGLGITVAGYVCEKEEISGIFVKSISKGSAADLTKNIKINDRIIEVDGVSVVGCTNHQAVELLRNTGPLVTITVERYLRGPKYEQLQQAIRANELRPPSPPSPSISSLQKIPLSLVHMSYLGIEPEGESRTSVDFDSTILLDASTPINEEQEIVIDGRRSLQFSIASQESIYDKWREKLEKEVEIVIAEMYKEFNSGLGISLEGTVDVEDGKEVRPHHYIRNILPDGPVGKNGILQSGDELLEVNGIQLLGLNHLEVVSILKQLPNFVCIVCARYLVPIRIIDTSQHREAFQARKILAGSLQTLIPSNENQLVKAKSETSITSSITSGAHTASRSRSLELIAGLPMWSEEPTVIELNKGDHGLGFSILDYQDPLNPQETVIVIRSLVPGGVAQADGHLIPGDRLLAVNDINVEHATLDRAVQVLKGAPRGIVKITVAKPLTSNDAVSHTSQDTEDDQTCFEDFQECLEEYQECLEVVHICIDEDTPFNNSPCTSQVEDFGQNTTIVDDAHETITNSDFLDNNYLVVTKLKTTRESIGDSDIDISFKSTNDNNLDNNSKLLSDCENKNVTNCITIKNNNKIEKLLNKADSLTQSDKLSNMTQSSNLSEKDGYETCVDESLSEDSSKIKQKRHSFTTYETENETKPTNQNKVQTTNLCSNENIININNKLNVVDVDVTPTNSKVNILDQLFLDTNQLQTTTTSSSSTITTVAVSEPCLVTESEHHLCLDSKLEDGLKSYDNRDSGGDEFFLVQYPPDTSKEVAKSFSEPNVLEKYHLPFPRRLTFRRCLKEYYNDYEDCLEAYKTYCEQQQQQQQSFCVKQEMSDEEIFNEIILPFKSRSAPDIMDRSFIMLTYDPGPDRNRRKSAFVTGCQWDDGERGLPMTVIRPIDSEYGTLKGIHVDDMLEKHWGSTHTVEIFREPNKSLGISIVGGKVDLDSSEKPGTDAVLGIFVKNVVPNSPAGSTGQFKTGDRILEVSGIDLRQANHEVAVQAIRNAPNPVKFVIQSLIPWKSHENEDAPNTCLSPFPSPVSIKGKTEAKQLETVLNDEKHDDVVLEIKVPETFIFKDNEEINKTNATELSNETNKTEKVVAAIESYEGSDDDEDDFEDVREMEGRTVSAMGHQIDRASAANLRRSKEEIAADPDKEDDFGYTSNKVKKKYANLGHNILMVQLERSSQGLGLSLAGHKDRNCMAVFVCGLNPNGVAYKTGGIQIGDEILEVNGVVLHGRCHLNASAIIKGLSGPIFKVIILRRKTAIDDIAVKPITQFPVSLAEEAIEEQLSASYPNVRTIPIKKGNQSLGIKIIEGKHAEVGQGIFISEIQEGSSAEKAGLEIGEMILAVNKDTLVGSNYETAANLLKRTEGLVTLVVSNPGRKDQAAQQTSDRTKRSVFENNKSNAISKPSTLKASAPPSRPTTPVPEPPADPATCPIIVGKETTIEIITDNKGLGIFFIGGKDTQISNGIIIVEVYPGGTADKDKRLQPGDQIIDVNGTSLKAVSHQTASLALRQTLPKVKITIYRPITIEYTTIDVDLLKKPGKGMGLSIVARKSGKGVYVSDIINGSIAEVDGRIIKGDLLITVNGQNVENSSGDEVGAILKTVMGRVSLKLHRYKIAR